jgi:hypothetical protein
VPSFRPRRRLTGGQGLTVDIVDGPVTAMTSWFRWDGVLISALNVLVIGLVVLLVAVALVPMSASPVTTPAG